MRSDNFFGWVLEGRVSACELAAAGGAAQMVRPRRCMSYYGGRNGPVRAETVSSSTRLPAKGSTNGDDTCWAAAFERLADAKAARSFALVVMSNVRSRRTNVKGIEMARRSRHGGLDSVPRCILGTRAAMCFSWPSIDTNSVVQRRVPASIRPPPLGINRSVYQQQPRTG